MASHQQALLATALAAAPPAPAGPEWPAVALLMKFEGANSGSVFSDLSSYSRSINNPPTFTPMIVRTSTSSKKFGVSSAIFGNDNVRLLPSGSIGASVAFSVQLWVLPFNYSSTLQGILFEFVKLSGDGFAGVTCGSQTNEVGVRFYLAGTAATWNSASPPYATYSDFIYIHAYKTGANIFLYANGVLQGSLAVSAATIITPGQYSVSIGGNGFTPAMTGWMDELRIVTGAVVPNTIPTTEFPIGSV